LSAAFGFGAASRLPPPRLGREKIDHDPRRIGEHHLVHAQARLAQRDVRAPWCPHPPSRRGRRVRAQLARTRHGLDRDPQLGRSVGASALHLVARPAVELDTIRVNFGCTPTRTSVTCTASAGARCTAPPPR